MVEEDGGVVDGVVVADVEVVPDPEPAPVVEVEAAELEVVVAPDVVVVPDPELLLEQAASVSATATRELATTTWAR